jgi:hypothetical protein
VKEADAIEVFLWSGTLLKGVAISDASAKVETLACPQEPEAHSPFQQDRQRHIVIDKPLKQVRL